MGRRPVPMQPISPDATPEQREWIVREYRMYLISGIRRSEVQLRDALLIALAIALAVVVALALIR